MATPDATATWSLALQSNARETALGDADALAQLKGAIDADIGSLREMQKALRSLQAASLGGGNQAAELKKQISAQKAIIGANTSELVKAGGAWQKVKPPAPAASLDFFGGIAAAAQHAQAAQKEAAERQREWMSVISSSGGPLGRLVAGVSSMKVGMLAGVAAGLALAGALLAVGAAAARAAVGLAGYALKQADARRSELLRLEGLTKIRTWWAGFGGTMTRGADSAGFLQSQIDRVSSSVALGRDAVADYASQLYRAGLRGGNLQAALEGVATTAAVQGDAQAQIFAGWAAGAALTGGSVRKLADDVKARLGGIAKAQLLSLSVQAAKMRENFNMLFSGLKLDRLLDGVAMITEMLSQASASGRALKAIMTSLLQPFGDSVGGVAIMVKRFFQGMIIGALNVAIGLAMLRNWWKKTFGGSDILRGIDTQRLAVIAGAAAVGVMVLTLMAAATVAGVLAVAFGAIAVALTPVIIGIGAIGGVIFAAGAAIVTGVVWILDQFAWLRDNIGSIDWAGLGRSAIDGIVAGIKGAIGSVAAAMREVGKAVSGAFKITMGIASPSRVMRADAIQVPKGAALGIRDGIPDVEAAMGDTSKAIRGAGGMGGETAGGAQGGGGAARGGFSIGSLSFTINAPPGADAEDIVMLAREGVRRELEGIALAMGVA